MPKIIDNIRKQLIDEAKRQIEECGYSKTTIRSVAGACNIGVGTVYNYFKSKDMLIATIVLEEWQECLMVMREGDKTDTKGYLKNMYMSLCSFVESHSALFRDEDAAKVFANAFNSRHIMLRGQIAEILKPVCCQSSDENDDFLPEFIAESLLTWTMQGKSFEEIYSVIWKLL